MANKRTSVMRDYEVRIVETGEIFYNGWALSDQKHYNSDKIRKCLLYPELTYRGFHFELIKPDKANFTIVNKGGYT